jgi:hypothetical protein
MPEIKEGSFTLDLGIVKLGHKLTEDDRQCAWELYTEIVTRVAAVGKRLDHTAEDFTGELYVESLTSLYNLFQECRGIMRKFPVGKIKESKQEHLGVLISRILADVIRPFFERWSGRFRSWWATASQKEGSPFDIQDQFPELKAFLKDWRDLRRMMRKIEHKLRDEYKLVRLD